MHAARLRPLICASVFQVRSSSSTPGSSRHNPYVALHCAWFAYAHCPCLRCARGFIRSSSAHRLLDDLPVSLQVVSFNWSPDKGGLACMAVLDQVRCIEGGDKCAHPLHFCSSKNLFYDVEYFTFVMNDLILKCKLPLCETWAHDSWSNRSCICRLCASQSSPSWININDGRLGKSWPYSKVTR